MTSVLSVLRKSQSIVCRNDGLRVERALSQAEKLSTISSGEIVRRAGGVRDLASPDGRISESQLDSGLPLVLEAVRRVFGFPLHPGQIVAGLTMTRGAIVELSTGEGKTLAAAIPAFFHALSGRGVHVATANGYLAARDAEQLRAVYDLLGLTCGVLIEKEPFSHRRCAYDCDITYGAAHEFGFDFLKDELRRYRERTDTLPGRVREMLCGNMSPGRSSLQRRLSFVLIDEADNVLLDDAVSPLLLSESSKEEATDAELHRHASQLVANFECPLHFRVHPVTSEIELTASGLEKVHLEIDALPFEFLERPWLEYVRQALRARHVLRRDVDYVVSTDPQSSGVQIVDPSTGRIFVDRTWRDGMHQAVEAKEGVRITAERRALGKITRQRFFQCYPRLAGMTGTIAGSEREMRGVYGLECVSIPSHRPCRRTHLPPIYYPCAETRLSAVADEVRRRHSLGQPVLIGTRSIEESEQVATALQEKRIPVALLNGRQDAEEAEVIASAGQIGAVTVSTNIAGRGTDIRPSAESLDRGGLHVLGFGHHRLTRIDRQLVGRSARQGQVGSSQFHVTADPSMKAHHPRLARQISGTRHTGKHCRNLDREVTRLQKRMERRDGLHRAALLRLDRDRETIIARFRGVTK